jgi:hypothetical protein
VPDGAPKLSDAEVELLRRLAVSADRREPAGSQQSFSDALTSPEPLDGIPSEASAREVLNIVNRELTRLTGRSVTLLGLHQDSSRAPTDDCLALRLALMAIIAKRDAIRAAALRQHQLEWLQLASSLDKAPLKIGAYQAHAERFLATAVEMMIDYFPWVNTELIIEENRKRSGKARGVVREKFRSGLYDLMLVPQDSESADLRFVYSYSFRIVGSTEALERLRDADDMINIHKLRGEKLLVAPKATSSRQRTRALFRAAGLDIEDGSVDLIEDSNPNNMRMRAETGQGLAIISDEYAAVGGSEREFPCLGLSRPNDRHQQRHTVDMGLLRQTWATKPRHRAFDFVVDELVAREEVRPRAAAQT